MAGPGNDGRTGRFRRCMLVILATFIPGSWIKISSMPVFRLQAYCHWPDMTFVQGFHFFIHFILIYKMYFTISTLDINFETYQRLWLSNSSAGTSNTWPEELNRECTQLPVQPTDSWQTSQEHVLNKGQSFQWFWENWISTLSELN